MSESINLNTCDKLTYLRYVMSRFGKSLLEAQEMWEISRHGQSDIIVDGAYDNASEAEPTART